MIYSNSLSAPGAIGLSVVCNFFGELLGGTAVAFGMVFLLPGTVVASLGMAIVLHTALV